jgi:hypothetical protein
MFEAENKIIFLKNSINKYKTLIYFIILSAVVLHLTKLDFIASGDSSWMLDPLCTDKRFVWFPDNLGFFSSVGDLMPLGVFFKIFQTFNIQGNIIQNLLFICFYAGSFFSMYFFTKKIFGEKKEPVILIVSSFYLFNAFNILSGFPERLFPIFIFWPIIFYSYYKFLHSRKYPYIIIIPLLSIFYTASNVNPAAVSVIYISLFLYLVFFLFTEKLEKKTYLEIFLKHSLLVFAFLAINSWWLLTFVSSMLQVSDIGARVNAFRATGTGFLFDHFRMLGDWAWYGAHYLYRYYSYSEGYYKPFMLTVSYLTALVPFVLFFGLRKKYFNSEKRKLFIFFIILFVLGIFLANGTKYEMGGAYEKIYESSKLFWMYREPWAKFMPLVVFSSAVMLYGAISYLYQSIKNRKIFYSIYLIIFGCILLSAYPIFTGELIWNKWNGNMRSYRVEIPQYWNDLKNFINAKNIGSERIFVFPFNYTYMGFNWEKGFFTAENPAAILLDNPVNKNSSFPLYKGESVINKVFDNAMNPDAFNLKRYLGILGTRYILQENDADWRFTGGKMLTPTAINEYIKKQGFAELSNFGRFTEDFLSKIPNDEPQKKLHDELYAELTGKPALVLYKMDSEYYLPHFYTPQFIISTSESVDKLPEILSFPSYPVRTAVYFSDQNEKYQLVYDKTAALADSINKEKQESSPAIEYKKINPTKYRVVIHRAQKEFPLVFSENFHDDWKMYLIKDRKEELVPINVSDYRISEGRADDQATAGEIRDFLVKGDISSLGDLGKIDFISKNFQGTIQNDNLPDGHFYETWLQKPVDGNKNHLIANGYANSWYIDPAAICQDNAKCVKNADGSYDLELAVEFQPQRLFYIGLFVSGAALLGCLGYFGWGIIKRKSKKSVAHV